MQFLALGHRSQRERTETSPLLGGRPKGRARGYQELKPNVAVEPLRRRDIPHATDCLHRAFVTDSMMIYWADADTAPFRTARMRAQHALLFHDAIRKKRMLTVHRGDAVMRYGVPGADNGMDRVHTFLTRLVQKFDTKELTKRKKEMEEKVGAMVGEALGERVADMYEVQALATAPEAQGHGYGSALVTTVTDMGDADGHDVWLITADARPFYEFLGFTAIRTTTIGEDNPKWTGAPVYMHLMYRPAKAGWREEDEKMGLESV
ncbi:hypothetical protein PYCCODRAFT_1399433 [Trametes coccinea BRFM310]|uniref:N-acetyltransferase domain-containing protein n=1 Tax=Trametes coccinea (strain BRFM310) TaxID=1353009 RepID=A0A1Y2I7I3_TRAC3|nr:hypothetical protein PYCCODRAFT_1399433 [Trametes coccinea BRFM310]